MWQQAILSAAQAVIQLQEQKAMWDNSKLKKMIEEDAKLRKYKIEPHQEMHNLPMPHEAQASVTFSMEKMAHMLMVTKNGKQMSAMMQQYATREQIATKLREMLQQLLDHMKREQEQQDEQSEDTQNEQDSEDSSNEDDADDDHTCGNPDQPQDWLQKLVASITIEFNKAGYA